MDACTARLCSSALRLVLQGEFWGEMGYAKVEKGNNALKLEGGCNWAVPGTWTEMATGGNTPCYEGGDNCNEHLPPPPPMNCEKYCTK
jgi:hypothetical protein